MGHCSQLLWGEASRVIMGAGCGGHPASPGCEAHGAAPPRQASQGAACTPGQGTDPPACRYHCDCPFFGRAK